MTPWQRQIARPGASVIKVCSIIVSKHIGAQYSVIPFKIVPLVIHTLLRSVTQERNHSLFELTGISAIAY